MEVARGAKKKIRQGKVLKNKYLGGATVLVVTFEPKLQKMEPQGLGDSSETGTSQAVGSRNVGVLEQKGSGVPCTQPAEVGRYHH